MAKINNKVLIDAAGYGYIKVVKDIIEDGGDINMQDKDRLSVTALMTAASYGQTETVHFLIKAGADLNIRDIYGNTALLWAAHGGRTEAVQALIRAGADLNTINKYGFSALELATQYGHTEVVETLKQFGLKKIRRNTMKETKLDQILLNERLKSLEHCYHEMCQTLDNFKDILDMVKECSNNIDKTIDKPKEIA